MSKRNAYLFAGLFAILIASSQGAALCQTATFTTGQTVYFQYFGKMEEGRVVSTDASGVLVQYKGPSGKFDGSCQRYYAAGDLKTSPPAGSSIGTQSTVSPTPNTSPAVPAIQQPAHTSGQTGGGPKLGRYTLMNFPTSAFGKGFVLGWFDVLPGNQYRTQSGGTGSFADGSGGVQWLSGPYKEQNLLGIFTITQEGKTHRIVLKKSSGGRDIMIGFNSK